MRRFGLFVLVVVLALLSFAPVSAQEMAAVEDVEVEWWDEAVWYLLFVRSFYDSDGDGIGDLQGVIEKLDYLNDGDPTTTDDLGITAIWLMPITDAASYHGYDTVDYRAIDPDYGTLEDFQALLAAAHERGIRIVMDLVVNHTSSQHPWFEASLAGDPDFVDWYVWAEENPAYIGPWGQRAWYQRAGMWYYAPFWSEMPDLNYDNPEVTAEMFDIAAFWVDEVGVDGFRLDAIKYVVEDEVDGRIILEDAPINRQWSANLTQYVKQFDPEVMTVGEIWDDTNVVVRYMRDEAVDMAFEFKLAEAIIASARSGNKREIERRIRSVVASYDYGQWATFTTNHDHPRLLTQLNSDVGANRVAATILLLSQGAPFIYYGEEIGMVGDKPDELIRTPMQWDDTPVTGGFTTGDPWQPLTPGFETVTVAAQTDDPDSLLSHYRALSHLRQAHPALTRGRTEVVESTYRSVLSFLRYTEDEAMLVIINLDDDETRDFTLTLDESPLRGLSGVEVLFGELDAAVPQIDDEGGFEAYVPFDQPMPPHSAVVIRLQ